MAIISSTKKEVKQELLAGKPITKSNLKNGEVLAYNSLRKQWEAKTISSEGTTDLSNYYNKDEIDALIPAVPDALADLSGTMDDIADGSAYVKTENNFTDELKEKLSGLESSSGLTQPQILARTLGC